jgi:hypothetical protein
MNFFKNKFTEILIISLLIIILLQKCGGCSSNGTPKDTIKSDTTVVMHHYDTTIYSKPTFIKGNTVSTTEIIHDTAYAPSANCDTLRDQYLNIASKYLSENIYRDSIPITDSLAKGYLIVNDTIKENSFKNRTAFAFLKYPSKTITNTITVHEKPKLQVYTGFGILGTKLQPVGGAEASIMIKTKKDNVYDVSAKYWNGEVIYGFGTKWKIKF